MSDCLIQCLLQGRIAAFIRPRTLRVQVFQKTLVAAVIFHVRQVRQYLEQHGLVVRLIHGVASLVGDDALRVTAKGSAPAFSGGAA